MAKLSSKFKIRVLTLVAYAFTAGQIFAQENAQKTPKTQAQSEVFPIKSKDLPTRDANAAPGIDIPPPDFKEFADDKLIDNLLADDKGASKPQDPTKIADPAAPSLPADNSGSALDKMHANDENSNAVKDETAATPNTPPNPSNENNTNNPTPELNASRAQDAPAVEAKTLTNPGNSQNADILSDAEKATYVQLKKHLLNFIANVNGKSSNVAAQENKPETPVAELPPETAPATEQQLPTPPAAAETANLAPNPAEPIPAPAPNAAPTPNTNNQSTQQTVDHANEIAKLLEPETKTTDSASPKPPAQNTVSAPAPTVKPAPAPANSNETAANIPTISKETPENAAKPSTPNVAAIPAIKPVAIDEDESDSKPLPKEKLSDADKAYLKLLENKRELLPDNKKLSDASKDAIDAVSAQIAPNKKTEKKAPEHIKIERGDKGTVTIEDKGASKSQSKIDLSVQKAEKGQDIEKTKVKLEKAYKALLVGQVAAAANIYKEILAKEPNNKDAMFGLATAYHKNNQFDQARSIYTKLLKNEPGNKEALNNFLVLVAEEAPEDALIELEKLERINTDFSPIPAQIAMINLKLGNTEKASRYLRRAILLSPDNVSYKYNLAITYDKMGKDEQAVQLYHQIIEAVQGGAVIPGSVDKLIERMTYLESKIVQKK